MKCDVNCKYYHMCWCIGEGTCEIGEDCEHYKPEPPKVAFLCKDKGTEYCHHTTHIEMARNFEKIGPNVWAEKEPKRGKWIEQEDNYGDPYYECSVCEDAFITLEGTPKENHYNFCPNCGADMREGGGT